MKIWNTARELIEWIDHHHAPMHENGGVDEINVGGLSGDLADLQDPKDHTHASAGSGVGGQLDWDNVWSDAVHNHSAAGEGGIIPATSVEVSELSTATYDDVQDFINQFGNRTHITGMVISDAYDGTCNISAGTGWCKVSDGLNVEGRFFDFAGGATDDVGAHALTDLAINYIYLDYNGGTPQIIHDDDGALLYTYDHIVLGCAFRHGTHCHIINSNYAGLDSAHQIKMRAYESFRAQRSSGLVTSEGGTRQPAVTAGVVWVGLTRETTLSFDTSSVTQGTATATTAYRLIDSGASFTSNDRHKTLKNTTSGTEYTDVLEVVSSTELRIEDDIFLDTETYDLYDAFDTWYTTDSGSTWTQTEHVTQIDSANYNDVTSGLAALSAASHYGVYWLYIDFEGHHLHMVYGQASEIQAKAEIAEVPSLLPPLAANFGILIAKILVQKDQDTMAISYPWAVAFSSSAATDHGNLAGLLDDDHTQYILHSLADAAGDFLVASGDNVFAKQTATQVLATLSGNANATFDWNGVKLTNVGNLEGREAAIIVQFDARRPAASAGYGFQINSYNASDVITPRLTIWSGVDEATVLWSDVVHNDFTLGNDLILNGQDIEAAASWMLINTTGSTGLIIESTRDSNVGGLIKLKLDGRTTPANDDYAGAVYGYADDSGGNETNWCQWRMLIETVTDGATEAGKQFWINRYAGADNTAMNLSGAGELWVDTFVNPDDGVKVSGTQVVAAQGAAVANATDAASTMARLNDLLARCRAHGLIAT